MTGRTLAVWAEDWPIAGGFAISRETRHTARVVVARVDDGRQAGRGEAVPYPRYGETVEGVVAAVEALGPAVADGLDREGLRLRQPPGAARNAVDCALWDLEAKRAGQPAWRLAGLRPPEPAVTAVTISLDTPQCMGAAAGRRFGAPLLKVKLDGERVVERMRAVRGNAVAARLIADANEAWDRALLDRVAGELGRLGVDLVEQPLPARHDADLAGYAGPVPLCADESVHTAADVASLPAAYGCVNVKLDKAGGLTEALAVVEAARAHGLSLMVSCMVGTSLAMAPATLLAGLADFVDLDGPLLLERDRETGLVYEKGRVHPAMPALWG